MKKEEKEKLEQTSAQATGQPPETPSKPASSQLAAQIPINMSADRHANGSPVCSLDELVIPTFSRKNFEHEFLTEFENAKARLKKAGDFELPHLRPEIAAASQGNKPRWCFGTGFAKPSLRCGECSWQRSCALATPPEIRKRIKNENAERLSEAEQERVQKGERHVREAYCQAHVEVFGRPPVDAVGSTRTLMEHAHQSKLPVRSFCLVFMSVWASRNPRLFFYSKYLLGASAVKTVDQIATASRREYGLSTEEYLALCLHVKLVDGQPQWRHQPTPTEDFLEKWEAEFENVHGTACTYSPHEIRRLLFITHPLNPAEMQELSATALEQLRGKHPPKSLDEFIRRHKGEPEPAERKEPRIVEIEKALGKLGTLDVEDHWQYCQLVKEKQRILESTPPSAAPFPARVRKQPTALLFGAGPTTPR